MKIIVARTSQGYWEDWMKESIQSTHPGQDMLLRVVFQGRKRRPENFLWPSWGQSFSYIDHAERFLFLWSFVPLRFQFLKEMKSFVILDGTHTCGTLNFLGVDQIWVAPSSVVVSGVFTCGFIIVGHTPQRCQSHPELSWSLYRENSCPWAQPSLLRICLPRDDDSHFTIPVCELLFIQTGIISLRELCVISAS